MITDQSKGLRYFVDPLGGLMQEMYSSSGPIVSDVLISPSPTKFMLRIYNLIVGKGKTVSIYDRSDERTWNNLKVTPPELYNDKFIDGNIIKYGDAKISISTVGLYFEPDLADIVTIDSVKWMIESVDKIWMSDNVVVIEMQLRKYGNTTLTPSSLWTKIDRSLVPSVYDIAESKGINATFHATPDVVRKVIVLSEFDIKLVDYDLVEEGDVRIYLPSKDLTFQPKAGMMVTYDNKSWLLVRESPIYSGEQVVIYELQLRR